MTKLNIGDKAPKFELESNEGSVKSEDLLGKNIILYFYPKDDTPGCTIEAKDFRDKKQEFADLDTVILGVSKDSVEKHQKFCNKYDLNFKLLADTDCKTCEDYGVYVEKSMFGKKYMGIERSTFVINKQGDIAKIWPKVKIKGHAQDVLDFIKTL